MNLRRIAFAARNAGRFYVDLLRFGDRPMRLAAPPAARRVLVLAPHPDDESIGCGGVISMYTSASTPVTVIFISDGARGGRTEAGESWPQARADEMAKTRRREAELAAGILGVTDCVFFGLPDGEVKASKEDVDALREHLSTIRPDLVFLPFMVDQHPDHLATNALFLDAAAAISPALSAECWGYEVWTPVYANRLIDITSIADAKWEAIRQYKSQTMSLDYLTSVQGLNAFRQRTTYKRSGYAEAFFAASLPEYRSLYQRMMAGR